MLDLSRLDAAVRHEGGVTRRLLLAYGAALAAVPTLGLRAAGQPKNKVKLKNDPFTLGVASGEPQDDSVVLWTRLAPQPHQPGGGMPTEGVDVAWVVANDEKLKDVVDKGTATAGAALGHSVHVVARGLKPDRWYWYQFRCDGYESPVGRTRTMPDPAAMPKLLRFAVASCQNYEDGHYTAYKHMAKEDLDLVYFLGDYIYEFGAHAKAVRKHNGSKPESLDEYRVRHCQYRADPDLHHMHARCPWVVTWDDHEVEGNYADATSKVKGTAPADFLKRRAHAYQAYYEMMPLRPQSVPKGPDMRLYRAVSFGQLASFKVLDTRQYRTDQPNGDNAAPLNAAAMSGNNKMLGAEQKKWLFEALGESKATWNVIAQQVMMGMLDRHGDKKYSMDAWTGYVHDRTELMAFLAKHKVRNPVVLTGDVHSSWVNDLREDDRNPKQPVVATEFVCSSITSKGDGEAVSAKRMAALKAANPCVQYHDDQRGYIVCTVTPKKWVSDFRNVAVVTKPDAPVVTGGSFVVEAGKPGASKA